MGVSYETIIVDRLPVKRNAAIVFFYGTTKRLGHVKSTTYTWFRAIPDRIKPLSGRYPCRRAVHMAVFQDFEIIFNINGRINFPPTDRCLSSRLKPDKALQLNRRTGNTCNSLSGGRHCSFHQGYQTSHGPV